jgi:PTS system ascorbate-specific IIA component
MTVLADAFGIGSISLDVSAGDWREAISLAGAALEVSGRATAEYTASMIRAVEDNGPYIVIAPGVALAHAAISPEVYSAGFALARLAQPVSFGHPEYDPVQLVFALSALDHDSHAPMMGEFAAWIMQPGQINFLLNADDEAEVRRSF